LTTSRLTPRSSLLTRRTRGHFRSAHTLRNRAAALACLALFSACTGSGSGSGSGSASKIPVQTPALVVAAFRDVVTGCSTPLTAAGEIDQRALAASGWTVTARSTRLTLEDRVLALDAYPALRDDEYEATVWHHARHVGEMQLIRWNPTSTTRSFDHCHSNGRVTKRTGEITAIVAGMAAHFGRQPDRTGAVPRGGDFLTPRSDPQQTGFYWKLPRHDVYLNTEPGGYSSVDVVAMPARESLDTYSPDRPENRLIVLPRVTAP
jgi:hypothetical protein